MTDTHLEISTEPMPVVAGWPKLIEGDYALGVVRLTTLIDNRVNHLLFASVELLPAEMPAPPAPPNGGWYQNFGSGRLCVGRTVVPLLEALAWYEALGRGHGLVPGKTFKVTAPRLAPEPDHNGFTVPPEPPPFSPMWHRRARLHRLVPMDPLADSVEMLRAGITDVEACVRARAWLRQHLHFDLLAYDEWLGSGVLIAPNPLLRDWAARIVTRSAEGETLEVGGLPRQGVDLSTLKVTVEEQRAGASGWRDEGTPNVLGRFYASAPSEVAAVRHDLFCHRRGVLDHEAPAWFFRGVSVGEAGEVSHRHVAPPRRTPGAKPKQIEVRSKPISLPDPPATALRQLERLQQARAARAGDQQPAEALRSAPIVRLLEHDRAATVAWICELIAQARSQVLFVDPYFDADDLQEFATAAQYQGVAIRVLINPRPGRVRDADENGELFGDHLLRKIEELRDPIQEFGDIDIRVSRVRRLHDRFLQVDDIVWHSGHSFNRMGMGEISLMTRVAEPNDTREALAEAFAAAEPFETYWANRPTPPWSLRQEAAHLLRVLAKWIERPRKARADEAADD